MVSVLVSSQQKVSVIKRKGMVELLAPPLIPVISFRPLACLNEPGCTYQKLTLPPRSCEPNWEHKEIRALVKPNVAMEPAREHGRSHLAGSTLSSLHWTQSWSHLSYLLHYPAQVKSYQDDMIVYVCCNLCIFLRKSAQTVEFLPWEFKRLYCLHEIIHRSRYVCSFLKASNIISMPC